MAAEEEEGGDAGEPAVKHQEAETPLGGNAAHNLDGMSGGLVIDRPGGGCACDLTNRGGVGGGWIVCPPKNIPPAATDR